MSPSGKSIERAINMAGAVAALSAWGACGAVPSDAETEASFQALWDPSGPAVPPRQPIIPDKLDPPAPECPRVIALENDPLAPLAPRAAFRLRDTDQWFMQGLRVAVLATMAPRRSLEHVVTDANRSGSRISSVPGVGCFHTGFVFDQDDQNTKWRPQGLSGSADAFPETSGVTPGGRKLLVVSWHDDKFSNDGEKGARVTFIDVTDMDRIRYRHVLLVEPFENGGGLVDIKSIDMHAGGIAWVGRYLYVAHRAEGFRVFDTEAILEADSDASYASIVGRVGNKLHAHGYKYLLPQVGLYAPDSACGMEFSWMSVDRSSDPPSLISGEYTKEKQAPHGRMYRWVLEPDGKLSRPPSPWPGITPAEVFELGQRQVQGGLSRRSGGQTRFWLTGKQNGLAKLFRKSRFAGNETFDWVDDNNRHTPQNLHHSPFSDNLWNLDEYSGRPVFACKLADLL